MEAKKILLVEDDPNFGSVLRDYLVINDFEVTLAKNGMEGFEKYKKSSFDLCILDVIKLNSEIKRTKRKNKTR